MRRSIPLMLMVLAATSSFAERKPVQTFLRTGPKPNQFTEFTWPATSLKGTEILIVRGDFGRAVYPSVYRVKGDKTVQLSRVGYRKARLNEVRMQFEIPLKQFQSGEYEVRLNRQVSEHLRFESRQETEQEQTLGRFEIVSGNKR